MFRMAGLTLLFALVGVAIAAGSPGVLDTTFGTNGIVVTPMNPRGMVAAIAVDSDGRIVAVGNDRWNVSGGSGYEMWAIHRYTASGALDTSFDADGKVTLFSSDQVFHADARDVAIADGKIVVVGRHIVPRGGTRYDADFTVVRLNADGSLDATFGGTGIVHTDFGGKKKTVEVSSAVAIQSDGKIVVAGTSYNATTTGQGGIAKKNTKTKSDAFALVRYHADGSLDTSFGNGGIVVDNFSTGDDSVGRGGSVTIDSDGRILVLGENDDSSAVVARYTSSGSVDTAFGTNGKIVPGGFRFAIGLGVDGFDRIVISGEGDGSLTPDATLVRRYGATGSLDTGFGTGGAATGVSVLDRGRGLAFDANGRILVVSARTYPTGSDVNTVVHRFTSAGALDTTFGPNADGVSAEADRGGGTDYSHRVAFDGAHRIVTGGSTSGPHWMLVRFEG